MRILNQAAMAAHEAKFHSLQSGRPQGRWSEYPVMETTFWDEVFKLAKNASTAEKVLDELKVIEDEPCFNESERVRSSWTAARHLAMATLLKKAVN